jgi:glutamate-1-semialdehyde aminotransferase
VDQPFYGRNDGENYNIGVVTSANLPYSELAEAMTATNERIYHVAAGLVEPYKTNIISIPPIHY